MKGVDSADYYADPANRRIAGPARRREPRRQLSNHVPIRFDPATMAWVRFLAARDSTTVSSWVRAVVEREVERRLPIARTGATPYELHSSLQDVAPAQHGTINEAGQVPPSLELVAAG